MSRRSRRQSKITQSSAAYLRQLVETEVARRLSQVPANAYSLPPAPPPPPIGGMDPLMQQMTAAQAPASMNESTPMFSPGAPLIPQPGMSPQGMPRGFVFPVGYNISARPRSTEQTSFGTLRNLAMLYDGIQLCEQVWLDTVAKLNLVIKPRPEIIIEAGNTASSSKYADRIRKYSDFFSYPDVGNGYDLKTWLRTAVRDQLQIDAVAMYVRRNKGGGVYSLELVDGASIKPLIDPRGRRPQPPYPAFQQFVYGVPGGLYTSEEMLYQRETTRTESIYGLSRVERIILRVNQALRKENRDLSHYTEGNVPPGLLEPPDDGSQWTPEQLMVYQELWDALLAGNDQARSRVKVVQPGSKYTALSEELPTTDFDRFLLNITAACYSMTMADLGFTESVNKSSGESQQNVFYRRAVEPLMDRYAQLFTFILRHYFNEQDLIVSWSGFEESEDFNAMAASYVALTGAGITSPTTAAHMMNLPWTGPEIPNYVMTKDGPMFLEDVAAPAIRKAALDAKMAGFELAKNAPSAPGQAEKAPENDASAPDGNEKQQQPPPKSGAKQGNDEGGSEGDESEGDEESQRIQRSAGGHTGIMVAFMLDEGTAAQLALPGGEPARDLHVTLAYLGDSSEISLDKEALNRTLVAIASTAQPLVGQVGGVGRFAPSPSSDEKSPVIALVNVPGLQDFRRKLVEAIEMTGCNVANNFDYTPHITLTYINADAPMPVDDVPSLPLVFDELCLAIGDDRSFFPLGGSNDAPDRAALPDNQRVPLVITGTNQHGNEVGETLMVRAKPAWRPPSKTQTDLETKLTKSIKAFLDKAKITKNGVEIPDETHQETLLNNVIDVLSEAIHEGQRIATGMEARGWGSLATTIAGHAVQVVGNIVAQIREQVAEIIDALVNGNEDVDPDEIVAEAEDAFASWSADYAETVAITEIHSAIEETVVDELQKQGVDEVNWDAEPDACKLCLENAEASPIAIDSTFPSGHSAPPGHPRCRCTTSRA